MTFVEEIALRQSLRLGLLAFGLFVAVGYGLFLSYRSQSLLKTLIKPIPLAAFTAAVAVSFGAPLIVVVLLLSAIGDAVLSRDSQAARMIGLVIFATAHVLFSVHLLQFASLPLVLTFFLPLLVMLLLTTELWFQPFAGELVWPVRGYIVLIAMMAATTSGMPENWWLVTGVTLFVLSNFLLAALFFRMSPQSPYQRITWTTNWFLYVGGQFFIVVGVGWSTPLF